MGAQVLEETVTYNETKVAAKASTVLVEKRDGRVVDFDPINIISAVKSAFGDLNKEVGPRRAIIVVSPTKSKAKSRSVSRPRQDRGHPNLVEHALIDAHLYDVARAYTNYRLDKDIQRAKATDVNEAVARFINHDPTLIHEKTRTRIPTSTPPSVICWPVPCPRPPRSTCCRRRCPTPT